MELMSQRISSDDRVLISASEASTIAGYSRQHMQRLLISRRVEGIKLGRDWFVYEDSLKTFLAQPHKPGPKGPRKKPLQGASNGAVADAQNEDTSKKS